MNSSSSNSSSGSASGGSRENSPERDKTMRSSIDKANSISSAEADGGKVITNLVKLRKKSRKYSHINSSNTTVPMSSASNQSVDNHNISKIQPSSFAPIISEISSISNHQYPSSNDQVAQTRNRRIDVIESNNLRHGRDNSNNLNEDPENKGNDNSNNKKRMKMSKSSESSSHTSSNPSSGISQNGNKGNSPNHFMIGLFGGADDDEEDDEDFIIENEDDLLALDYEPNKYSIPFEEIDWLINDQKLHQEFNSLKNLNGPSLSSVAAVNTTNSSMLIQDQGMNDINTSIERMPRALSSLSTLSNLMPFTPSAVNESAFEEASAIATKAIQPPETSNLLPFTAHMSSTSHFDGNVANSLASLVPMRDSRKRIEMLKEKQMRKSKRNELMKQKTRQKLLQEREKISEMIKTHYQLLVQTILLDRSEYLQSHMNNNKNSTMVSAACFEILENLFIQADADKDDLDEENINDIQTSENLQPSLSSSVYSGLNKSKYVKFKEEVNKVIGSKNDKSNDTTSYLPSWMQSQLNPIAKPLQSVYDDVKNDFTREDILISTKKSKPR